MRKTLLIVAVSLTAALASMRAQTGADSVAAFYQRWMGSAAQVQAANETNMDDRRRS